MMKKKVVIVIETVIDEEQVKDPNGSLERLCMNLYTTCRRHIGQTNTGNVTWKDCGTHIPGENWGWGIK